jgi:di/tricarboxylate transporter
MFSTFLSSLRFISNPNSSAIVYPLIARERELSP